jgi:hypothetical protein
MSGPLTDEIKKNTQLWKDGENLNVRYSVPGKKGSIVVTVPFAPIMTLAQNLSMLYGSKQNPQTRPNTIMGYAPVLSMITSQLASEKIKTDKGESDGSGKNSGPIDLSSIASLLPILLGELEIYEEGPSYSEATEIILGQEAEMGLNCNSSIRNTPACRRMHVMGSYVPKRVKPYRMAQYYQMPVNVLGEEIDLGDEVDLGDEIVMGGGCGCGVPCDGIQPNNDYMSDANVAFRASQFTPWNAARSNAFWRSAPRINDQWDNDFGRKGTPPPSATPPHGWPNEPIQINEVKKTQPDEEHKVQGWVDEYGQYFEEEQVPCAKGGTCGKSCCGH